MLVTSPAQATAPEGTELIGTKAPRWDVTAWVNSKPLSLDELKGSVVLVRWWTGPECSYCAASAPNLNAWHQQYHDKGLVVIGFYHHKSPEPLSHPHVTQLIKRYRFKFPVAIDPDWQTLKCWWLDGHDRQWTSASLLIDREGVIRYVHPGGSYTQEDAKVMEAIIRELLEHPLPGKTSTEPNRYRFFFDPSVKQA